MAGGPVVSAHRAAAALLVSLAAPAPGPAAAARADPSREAVTVVQPARPGEPAHPEQLEHRRRVEQGERASRAYRPPPRVGPPPDNGIVEVKGDLEIPGSALPISTKPSCPKFWPALGTNAAQKSRGFHKAFPEVSWYVCVTDIGRHALWIGPVWMKRTPAAPWMVVIALAGPAEIFVPYHDTAAFRFYDLRWTSALDQVTWQDAGINGTIHTLSNETVPTVVAEIRDRGIGWMCKGGLGRSPDPMMVRRGQELVLWGVSDGGNYDNIIEYGFRDDGGMTFRMGNTGFTSPARPTEAHSHVALWYVDMDLNGPAGDTAYWFEHEEPSPSSAPLKAHDYLYQYDTEWARRWDSAKYTSLVIADTATNAYGWPIRYAFTPVQDGLSRHYGWQESWTENDVYVTRARASELSWTKGNWKVPDQYLLSYLNNETVSGGKNLAIWIKSSAHHLPLSEDKSSADIGTDGSTGITLTHWNGFRIDPFDLFDTNPLGGPIQC